MPDLSPHAYRAVVIGVSAGGLSALKQLLGALPGDFSLPIVIVQHILADSPSCLADILDAECAVHIKEAEECEQIIAGFVYLAPPNYHLMLEHDATLSLTTDNPVCFARPSIDVLFESAAQAFNCGLIGIILTGANSDGAYGLQCIQRHGGTVIVQDPQDAEVDGMPLAALQAVNPDYVEKLSNIGPLLEKLAPQPTCAAVPKSEKIR